MYLLLKKIAGLQLSGEIKRNNSYLTLRKLQKKFLVTITDVNYAPVYKLT